MFGQNKVRKFESTEGGKILQVHEIFYTLQGEGPFSGQAAVFIRLTGCNLRCHFCDTKWDDIEDKYRSAEDIAQEAQSYAYTPGAGFRTRLVVLTGGEPLRQDLTKLLQLLVYKHGLRVQIETAGTIWQDCLKHYLRHEVSLVVSPKTPQIHPEIIKRADAIKYVIKRGDSFDQVTGELMTDGTQRGQESKFTTLAAGLPETPVYLSPCDEYSESTNRYNREHVAKLALAHGYIAGVQLHKALNLP